MRPINVLAISLLTLAACNDETLSGYAPEKTTWVWQELDGGPAPARATLTLGPRGQVSGQAPCNSYSAKVTVPYPWFELGNIIATRRACPELADETAYFSALEAMSLAEVSGDTLLLSNDAGRDMLFVASP
ncbi:hypothetical protein XMM379_000914 [Aliiroseovarius sp. xm-m-379]|uniref:META domain-containing protein n=1 Tax=unclassified Aliiroseovarius TaxID=2623558 RepID=UPI0015692EE5|nr:MULTISPECIES: META domain-containing protein [unclassified Aliiroseovarius]NRP12932.1 hypothetical protein [Aliiroseovarius sp. xm-d-517]NRP24234.1 hypothetical protein [Aliiroseovarius sp. xm-m-379]NRP29954.1 hypothetical protein [Aliiroseovarius sp. xm-m-314]NRP33033.1 hypothetical protein [Aliiroseovarius sp. xm-a-104]NRP39965.1 hypothetical protein [Aliiroseovarius sp. xm-m-339-2]